MNKKIIFIVPTLEGGGAEKNTINIINTLDTTLFEIILIICGGKDNYSQLLEVNTKIIKLNKHSVKFAVKDISKIIKTEKPSIVFTSAGHLTIAVILLKICRIIPNNFIKITRIPSLPSNGLAKSLKSKFVTFFISHMVHKSDWIIAQTDEMRNEIIEMYNTSSKKVKTIFNVVNHKQLLEMSKLEYSEYSNLDYNIIAVGTLYSVKGFDILINAISLLKERIPNIKLHILGREGIELDYKSELVLLTSKLNLTETVIFHDFTPNPYPYLKNADLFVLSSRKEGFPNVVLEALTLGTPVVATDCVNFGGIIFDGVNGIVVRKNNASDLAKGILECKDITLQETKFENFDYNGWFLELIETQSIQ